ncbi:hypothetical protein ACFX2B_011012 [Malus domestica]
MKRRRRSGGGGAGVDQAPSFEVTTTKTVAAASKKGKKTVDKSVKEEARIDGGDDQQLGLVAADQNLMAGDENYWGNLGGGVAVDEQMSWGSVWLPLWDVEFMEESHYRLFSDVIWDDDIWGLRTTKEIPNP